MKKTERDDSECSCEDKQCINVVLLKNEVRIQFDSENQTDIVDGFIDTCAKKIATIVE